MLGWVMVNRAPVKCLVVDDDHESAEALGDFLEILGADVRVVYGGQEAVAMAPQFEPRMVVLDITMPTIDGFQTCILLKQQEWSDDAVFIAYTGAPTQKDAAFAAGFDRVVSKGDSPSVLETILDGLVPDE